jgi:GntR family transcriptional regulator, transcriptional repressor for pyruvate dehydrogenase complex
MTDPVQPNVRMHERLGIEVARDIVSGRMAAGEALPPIEELAEQHDVSRTVGREAVQALAATGLINVRHGRRTTVNPVTEWRFLDPLVQQALRLEQLDQRLAKDLFDLRLLLEYGAARRCAEMATEEQLATIAAQADKMLSLVEDSQQLDSERMKQWVDGDLRFHRLIAEASGNLVLVNLINDIRQQLIPTWSIERLSRDEMLEVARTHVEISSKLKERDADRAGEAMLRHVSRSFETTVMRAVGAEGLKGASSFGSNGDS